MVAATPTHVALSLQVVQIGAAVVGDEPLATSVKELEGLAEELGNVGLADRVTVHHNRRWDGDFLTMQ